MDWLFDISSSYAPFAVAAGLIAVIAVLESVSLLVGGGILELFDELVPELDQGSFLAWLGFGRVPFIAILVVILAAFAICGVMIQSAVSNLFGAPLSGSTASLIAFLAGLPLAAVGTNGLARIFPESESSGVDRESLTGCLGTIVQGRATPELTAEARVRDPKGSQHWIRVRAERGETIEPGTEVRVIAHEDEVCFTVRATSGDESV